MHIISGANACRLAPKLNATHETEMSYAIFKRILPAKNRLKIRTFSLGWKNKILTKKEKSVIKPRGSLSH